jgi:hypothetical protein
MSTRSRISLLSEAFRDTPLTFLGAPMRPVTAGTILLLMETGNPLFSETEKDVTEEESPIGIFQSLFEFIHIHTAPEDEVLTDCETPDLLKRKAKMLAMKCPMEEIQKFADGFTQMNTRLAAATAEIIPDKSEGKPEAATTPPPTGSPTSSTPSAAQATPPASDGSSGNSPSSEPSNTSTPPTSPTEREPAGASRTWEPDPTEIPPEEIPENVIPLP